VTRRKILTALPALALAPVPEVTAPAGEDRFRQALARVQEAEAALRQATVAYEAQREAINLGMSRGERPSRLRAMWRTRVAAREEMEAAKRELAEAERRCDEAERLAGEG
jgi:hypothetical protein